MKASSIFKRLVVCHLLGSYLYWPLLWVLRPGWNLSFLDLGNTRLLVGAPLTVPAMLSVKTISFILDYHPPSGPKLLWVSCPYVLLLGVVWLGLTALPRTRVGRTAARLIQRLWARRSIRAGIVGVALAGILVAGWSIATHPVFTGLSDDEWALLQAADNGDMDEVRRLIESGVDANIAEPKWSLSALVNAAGRGDTAMAEYLLAKGADVDKGSPLDAAADTGETAMVRFLLQRGADPNRFRVGNIPAPLLSASRKGNVEILKLLIEFGADVKAEDPYNPLRLAASGGHKEFVEILLAHGAPVNVRDSDGQTPLGYAIRKGYDDIAEILRKHGGVE